jgi:hypothetical protein
MHCTVPTVYVRHFIPTIKIRRTTPTSTTGHISGGNRPE